MLKKIVTLVFMFFFILVFSQDDKKLTKVSYTFDLNLNSYSEGIPYKAELYFNDSLSLFVYNSVKLEGVAGFRKMVKDRTGRVDGISFFRNYDEIGLKFYLKINDRELTSRQLSYELYESIVREKDINFNWQITKETKTIGNYLCYKATTENFRGRNYEVWFTYDIPIATGPWKFHGLPGLIIEVHDDKDLINITFNELNKIDQNDIELEKPISENDQNSIDYNRPDFENVYTLEMYLEECFRLYLNYVDRQKDAIIQGLLPSNATHPSYVNIEYNKDQIKLLNQYHQIEYSDYEKSKEIKDTKD
ncbi:GLPGLI family protein [Winogradskyella echinorum]|uniref:GLPGLI family protein n=1 Tax=Winogradskyella echinorum TaxID=538189 RepID=A0ABR6Y0H4_9FLAO|nr:GLPGLI family protein [Winogradskyella echinorum]MBC3846184.1 GLPGLI family protein [Winogradskyella echinorum]MBC5750532.1 GLPGLI family protein [Winogradskyella echinorum]